MGLLKFKKIRPKSFNENAFVQSFNRAIKSFANDVQKDFNLTTKSWNHNVDWENIQVASLSQVYFKVTTVDQIYTWVNSGTATGRGGSTYEIHPRNKNILAYRENFQPKTTPGLIGSFSGGRTGNYTLRSYTVHPGMRAREFDKTIKKHYSPLFKPAMLTAMSDFVDKSRHRF